MKALQRWGGPAAMLAGVLWAAQGLIWTFGPKVQAAEPPYRIIDRPSLRCSGSRSSAQSYGSVAALLGLLRRDEGRQHLVLQVTKASTIAAWASLVIAGAGGFAVLLAAFGIAEEFGLAILAPALNLAGLLLLIAVSLAGVAVPRAGILTGRRAALPAVLAFLTLLTLGAIFVDESQDTFVEVVEALKRVRAIAGDRFCLGFFGDPMQKVYPRGVGDIHSDPDWAEIKKPENFRSPQRVLDLMNDIRSPVDGLRQVSGLSPEKLSDGKVFFFVVPADDSRTQSLCKVREYLDNVTNRCEWTTDDPAVGCKILVIARTGWRRGGSASKSSTRRSMIQDRQAFLRRSTMEQLGR